ncbi:hypothetical protein GCM10023317_16440 [Actinopolymorpha pittospori]
MAVREQDERRVGDNVCPECQVASADPTSQAPTSEGASTPEGL